MNNNFIIFLFFLLSFLYSQPDSQFNPFDWVQYRKTGSINSISSSSSYIYLGSENGGILRFNIFSERLDEPITKAQGLRSNSIKALHYDYNGYLWVATPFGVEYSITAEGSWRFLSNNELGIPFNSFVHQIGESEDGIWINAGNLYYRLDRITGVILESMAVPNKNVDWSSSTNSYGNEFSSLIIDYSLLDGWISDLESLINPNGKKISITTYYFNKMNELWIGTEEGYFFKGDNTMKTLKPFYSGLAGDHIYDIEGKKYFWLGGKLEGRSDGISYFDPLTKSFDLYLFDETINMDRTSIFSIIEMKNKVWFSGDGVILSYNKKNDFWKTIRLSMGNPRDQISSFIYIDDHVWFGSYNGLQTLDINGSIIKNEILQFFKNINIYDLAVKNNFLFIASGIGLYIYDIKNNKIFDYKNFGYRPNDFLPLTRNTAYTDLAYNSRNIYAANQSGIISFNFRNRKWSNAVDPSIFGGLKVKSMAIEKDIIFLSTINGVIKFDMRKNFMNIYNYSFIGEVNDMYIKGRKLWLGTSEGLISFQYK